MVAMPRKIKWAAKLDHVQEATLVGDADLAYWRRVFVQHDLVPASFDGAAQIMVMAASARFKGVRFREVSFAVYVERPGDPDGGPAAYLAQAFNSQRFFAFVERAVFKTPYIHAQVEVAPAPAAFRVAVRGQLLLQAGMAADPAQAPTAPTITDEQFDGVVFLPPKSAEGPSDRLFFAGLRGETHTTPFDAQRDVWTVSTDPTAPPICRMLHESGFTPREWTVRFDAHHAKSKTYRRAKLLPAGR